MKDKVYARSLCPIDKSETFFFEYNPDWKGLRVMQITCTKCKMAVPLYELNEASIFIEAKEIEEELDNL